MIAWVAFFPYSGCMNFKGILLVALLALFGPAVGMSQIEAGHAIRLTIKGVPAEEKAKIDADYPVSKEGAVNLPYLGQVKAAGKTTEQLARDIEKAFVDAKIFMEPAVEVLMGGFTQDPGRGPVIHIGGEVRRPGPIPFTEGMTLWKAIQAAGGSTEFGSLKRVKLYRDGKLIVYDMQQKENRSVTLKLNDTIEVPQRNFGCGEH